MQKISRVAAMFSEIAEDYDRMNHLMTFHVDSVWRRVLVRSLKLPEKAVVLDACTGTGDLALALSGTAAVSRVYAADFSSAMLKRAKRKIVRRDPEKRIRLLECDVINLPYPDSRFDAVTMAFGLRNISDKFKCLKEFHRVVRKGGVLRILEFSPVPPGILSSLMRLYVNLFIPLLGALVTGAYNAYQYLSRSIAGFYSPEKVIKTLRDAGWSKITCKRLFPGIAFLYLAEK